MSFHDPIKAVTIHHPPSVTLSEAVLREQQTAIDSLLHSHAFHITGGESGPYILDLHMDNDGLRLVICREIGTENREITLPARPYRKIIKDYFLICDSYEKAYTGGDAVRLEPVDMARRALHDEGATLILDHLVGKGIETDHQTARNLFTLMCILHIGRVRQW